MNMRRCNIMQKALVVVGGLVLCSMLWTGVAFAATSPSAAYPQVANLTPFTAEANFMSLAGYLRYLAFEKLGSWITRSEAVRVVQQEQGV
jgi:hypothetical protein